MPELSSNLNYDDKYRLRKRQKKLFCKRVWEFAYNILFNTENKNVNEAFNTWRYRALLRGMQGDRNLESAVGQFSPREVDRHWVTKPMGSEYHCLITRLRLGITLQILEPYFRQESSILDVGAASGLLLHHLNSQRKAAIDRNSQCVEEMLKRGIEAYQADACSLPFADDEFEWVLMLECLEHLPSPLLALAECRRVASKGVFVSFPHFQRTRVAPYLKNACFKGDLHVFELTPEDFCQLCEHIGLEIVEYQNLNVKQIAARTFLDRMLTFLVGQKWPYWHIYRLQRLSGR